MPLRPSSMACHTSRWNPKACQPRAASQAPAGSIEGGSEGLRIGTTDFDANRCRYWTLGTWAARQWATSICHCLRGSGAMSEKTKEGETPRESVLSPVDRISELLFGLLMALSFTGAIAVAETG